MTLEEIKKIVLRADPQARHYDGGQSEGSYTTWQERAPLDLSANDKKAGGWRFTIVRFFDLDGAEVTDPVAEKIQRVLDDTPEVAYDLEVIDQSADGYIQYAFTCEGI